eukprot:314871-Lingulodinium_polyedra.AAC.1
MVCTDVLHAVDLGVAQDAIGNVLWEFANSPLCTGRTIEDRVQETWALLKEHYTVMRTPNRLQSLTVPMLKVHKEGPKLRAK